MWSDPEMKRLMREVRSILKDIPKRDPQDKKFERQAFVTKTDFYNRMSTLKDKDPKKSLPSQEGIRKSHSRSFSSLG